MNPLLTIITYFVVFQYIFQVNGPETLPWHSAGILVFLGVFQIAGAYTLFLRGLRHVTATRAAILGMAEPVANPLWVFLLLGERPALLSLLGGAVVLGAIAWRTLSAPALPPAAEVAPPD